jgi:predicted aspartyl protease
MFVLWIALTMTAMLFAQSSSDVADLSARAAKAFRSGRVREARALYESAVSQQSRYAPALAGLGRIDLIEHHRHSALSKLALAYQIAPNDPEIVRDFAAASDDVALETVLLQRLINLPSTSPRDREFAQFHLAFHRKLADRRTHLLLSPYQPYLIRMPLAVSNDQRPYGWVLKVTFNEGFHAPLRLLLDTGARGILLFGGDKTKALGLEPLAPVTIGGFGDGERQSAQTMLARRISIDGQLEIGNVVVEVAKGRQAIGGLDGLIAPDIFRHFLITFQGPRRQLELTPFQGHDPAAASGEHAWAGTDPAPLLEGFEPVRRLGHLYLIEDDKAGQFVIDTGASYTVVHESTPSLNAETVSLFGVSGEAKLARVKFPVAVSLGGARTWTRDAVSTDLTAISDQYGMHLSGFLGFPIVRQLEMSIDSRNGSIRVRRQR